MAQTRESVSFEVPTMCRRNLVMVGSSEKWSSGRMNAHSTRTTAALVPCSTRLTSFENCQKQRSARMGRRLPIVRYLLYALSVLRASSKKKHGQQNNNRNAEGPRRDVTDCAFFLNVFHVRACLSIVDDARPMPLKPQLATATDYTD